MTNPTGMTDELWQTWRGTGGPYKTLPSPKMYDRLKLKAKMYRAMMRKGDVDRADELRNDVYDGIDQLEEKKVDGAPLRKLWWLVQFGNQAS